MRQWTAFAIILCAAVIAVIGWRLGAIGPEFERQISSAIEARQEALLSVEPALPGLSTMSQSRDRFAAMANRRRQAQEAIDSVRPPAPHLLALTRVLDAVSDRADVYIERLDFSAVGMQLDISTPEADASSGPEVFSRLRETLGDVYRLSGGFPPVTSGPGMRERRLYRISGPYVQPQTQAAATGGAR